MSRRQWLTSANYSSRLVIDLKRRKRAKSRPSEPPRIVRLLEQAEQWQRMLDSGEARTRSEVAKRAGVSANRVTNLLALLKLHPTVLDAIRALPPGAPELGGASEAAPVFSLSHSGGVALCAVAPRGTRLGCDLEQVEQRRHAFIEDFFTTEERELVSSAEKADRPLIATLVWSAKESALKALRTGLRADTRSVIVRYSGDPEQPDWHPLQVTAEGKPQPLHGWWRTRPGAILTLVSEPAPDRPMHLSR